MNTRRQLVAGIAAAIVVPRGARVQAFPARPARFGVCGPKGMEPALVRTLHDAFRKTLEDPAVLATLDKYDQSVLYMNTETYTKFARDSFVAEKATIERLGLAAKG